ncbi:hypothetical protein TNCV_1358271 [Trichonephila clavipes]|uniref:Uncharacterized protein n=1 Tax=Trichonephila clavipes TaxID=2585209 RepID=A0A8X6V840_TRICX|nr:hypothetical protein TNCV_1358271 [Trichonephila clavipes]
MTDDFTSPSLRGERQSEKENAPGLCNQGVESVGSSMALRNTLEARFLSFFFGHFHFRIFQHVATLISENN